MPFPFLIRHLPHGKRDLDTNLSNFLVGNITSEINREYIKLILPSVHRALRLWGSMLFWGQLDPALAYHELNYVVLHMTPSQGWVQGIMDHKHQKLSQPFSQPLVWMTWGYRTVVLNHGWFCPQEDMWQHIETFFFLLYFSLQYCIGFAIHWHESTTGVYMSSQSWTPLPPPPHIISLDHPCAPAPSILYPVSNIDWQFVSYLIVYMFQCHSPKSSHPLPLPQSPKSILYICVSFAVSHTGFSLPSF